MTTTAGEELAGALWHEAARLREARKTSLESFTCFGGGGGLQWWRAAVESFNLRCRVILSVDDEV